MEDEDRVGSGAICAEYRRQTGKAAQFSHTQISAWMRNGELDAIGAELGQNGRWSVIRSRIPLLEHLAPVLRAQAMGRMRHEHLRNAEAAA